MDVDILQIDREEAADFLIVCVKQIEADAIDSLLTPICTDSELLVKVEGREYKLGKIGNFNSSICPSGLARDQGCLYAWYMLRSKR